MIDFSVVVLPAPLRPSSVTTSPAATWKWAPWSTWDSPYQACSASTASKGAVAGLSMANSEIGFAHARVGRDRLIVALSEHAAAREDGDAVREVGNHAEIMLHHQHGAGSGDRLDESADAIDVFVPHACHGLVEQKHLGVERQGRGDLQGAFAAIGQFHRGGSGKG